MYVGTHTKRDFAKGDERQILKIKADSHKKKQNQVSKIILCHRQKKMNIILITATIKAVFLNSLPVLILNKQANKSACPEFNYLDNFFYGKTQNSSKLASFNANSN